MKIQDILSFWLGIGLLIICGINISFIFYLKLHFNYPISIFIIHSFPMFFLIPSAILFLYYSLNKVSNYAKLGFILGIPFWTFFLWITVSFISLYFSISVISISSIILALIFTSIIFSRRKKIDTAIPLKNSFKFTPSRLSYILLYILGIFLIIIQLTLFLNIFYNYRISSKLLTQYSDLFNFIPLFFDDLESAKGFFYLGLIISANHQNINSQLSQFFDIAKYLIILGSILILIGVFLHIIRKQRLKDSPEPQ